MLQMRARLHQDEAGTAGVLLLDGHVDSLDAPQLDAALGRFLEAGILDVVVDLSQVQFISSAGWGVFVGTLSELRNRDAHLRFAGMNAELAREFDIIGIGLVEGIETYSSVAAALDSRHFVR